MLFVHHHLMTLATLAGARLGRAGRDRGDVPGWVLVTVMTAGLVAALWALAGDTLADVFSNAIQDTVGGP